VDIRDARTGESLRSFPGHDVDVDDLAFNHDEDDDINDVAFNHDGSVLATTGDDGTAAAWDPTTGEELWRIEGASDDTVWGPTFSPDGTLFAASWSGEGITRVVDVASGRTTREIAAVPGPDRASFSPDGTQLAIASSALPLAVVVDTDTGTEAFRLEGHRAPLGDVAWSPDGRWLATSGKDGSPRIWDARTGDVRFTLHGHVAWVMDVDWSPDSRRLATASDDGTAKVWRIMASGTRQQQSFRAQETSSGVRGVAFSPEGDRLMGGDIAITAVKVWDLGITGDAEHANFPAVPLHNGAAAFMPDGRHVVASTVGGSATVWDLATGRRQLTFGFEDPSTSPGGIDVFGADPLVDRQTGADIVAIDVSPDGRLIAAASLAGAAGVWDAATGERRFAVDGRSIVDVAWSPDGEVVAMAGGANPSRVTILDRSGEQVTVLDEEPGAAFGSVAFSPGGRLVATARTTTGPAEPRDAEVRIWDWEEEEVVRTIDVPADRAVAFDPSSTRIAMPAADDNGVVEVWDSATGHKEASLSGHTSGVWDVDFAPDGSAVATASLDGTVRLWDVASGQRVLVLRGHQAPTTSVAFSPDGTRLASVSGDGTTRVWAVDLDDLIGLAKDELTRTFTDEECQDYLHLASCPPP
jgi:WD40 repeat protein